MGRAARKLNFIIEEGIYRELEKLVPSGKRSRIINEALRKELISLRRRRAVEQLAASSSVGKKYSNREILNGLAKDRRAR